MLRTEHHEEAKASLEKMDREEGNTENDGEGSLQESAILTSQSLESQRRPERAEKGRDAQSHSAGRRKEDDQVAERNFLMKAQRSITMTKQKLKSKDGQDLQGFKSFNCKKKRRQTVKQIMAKTRSSDHVELSACKLLKEQVKDQVQHLYRKQSTLMQTQKMKNVYRFMYQNDNYKSYQKDLEEINLTYDEKYARIRTNLQKQTKCQLKMDHMITKYLKTPNNNKDDDVQSNSTISSADDYDLEILMTGGHHIYFDAFDMMKEFFEMNEKSQKEDLQRHNLLNSMNNAKNVLCCLRKRGDESQDPNQQRKWYQISRFKGKFKLKVENKLKKSLNKNMKGMNSSVKKNQVQLQQQQDSIEQPLQQERERNTQSMLKIGSKRASVSSIFFGVRNSVTGSNPYRPPRPAPELWKIARKLVMAIVKNNQDIAANVLKSVRQKKMIEQQEAIRRRNERANQEKLMTQRNSLMIQSQFEKHTMCQNIEQRIADLYRKFLIDPRNRKLKYFHLIVACTLFFDFIITGLIMGNYRFVHGYEEQADFIDHQEKYFYICFIQILDIFLNFFKMRETSNKQEQSPKELVLSYLKGNFIPDVIAVVPYSILIPSYIFLRYLKLLKYNTYLQYVQQFLEEIFNSCMNSQQINHYMSIFTLLFQLFMVSHFFASIWSYIGQYLYYTGQGGWITANMEAGIQEEKWDALYLTSVYWVVTTFTSIGYGDVCGNTIIEYIFQIVVMMFGICFFGYMTGNIQNLIANIGTRDHLAEENEKLDQWIIKLDKVNKDKRLPQQTYASIRGYYDCKFRKDCMMIQETTFFQQLKPRLQRLLLDQIFEPYYTTFEIPFSECEADFRRQIIMNCKFEFYYCSNQPAGNDSNQAVQWPQREMKPQLEMSGQVSKKVYFVLSGMIHIMDKNGLYEYGIIHEGSYFGDISILLNEPSEYSYCYNPYSDRSVQFLAIDADDFLKICRSHPCSFEVMLQRALNKKLIYQSYKMMTLLGFMKQLMKRPGFLRRKLLEGKTIQDRIDTMVALDMRIGLYRCLTEQYHLARIYTITWSLEQILKQQKSTDAAHIVQLKQIMSKKVSEMVNRREEKGKRGESRGSFGRSRSAIAGNDRRMPNLLDQVYSEMKANLKSTANDMQLFTQVNQQIVNMDLKSPEMQQSDKLNQRSVLDSLSSEGPRNFGSPENLKNAQIGSGIINNGPNSKSSTNHHQSSSNSKMRIINSGAQSQLANSNQHQQKGGDTHFLLAQRNNFIGATSSQAATNVASSKKPPMASGTTPGANRFQSKAQTRYAGPPSKISQISEQDSVATVISNSNGKRKLLERRQNQPKIQQQRRKVVNQSRDVTSFEGGDQSLPKLEKGHNSAKAPVARPWRARKLKKSQTAKMTTVVLNESSEKEETESDVVTSSSFDNDLEEGDGESKDRESDRSEDLETLKLKAETTEDISVCINKNEKQLRSQLCIYMNHRKLQKDKQQKNLMTKFANNIKARGRAKLQELKQWKAVKEDIDPGLNHTVELSADCNSFGSQGESSSDHAEDIFKIKEEKHDHSPLMKHNCTEKHIDMILDEYFNTMILNYDMSRGSSCQQHYQKTMNLIMNGRIMNDMVCPTIPSILQIRKDVATQLGIADQRRVNGALIRSEMVKVEGEVKKNLEENQQEEIKRVEFIDQSNNQILVKNTQMTQENITKELNKDIQTNRLFEPLYAHELQDLVNQIQQMKDSLNRKMKMLVEKRKFVLRKKQFKARIQGPAP